MASSATWRELAEVCLQLGHHDEALTTYEKITDPRQRREVEHLLQRRGLLPREGNGHGEEVESAPRSVKDDALDAAHILFEDHMPLTTIVTTMTFPVVVGLGGFLTAGTNFFLFPAIAALPALCVAAVVGGMSRRILIDAACGLQEPPRIPEVRELSRQSGRFLLDALVLTVVLLGPAIALGIVQGPMVSTLVATALGAFLLPGALAIRQLTEDWRALSPNYLFAAVTRLRGDYAATACICALVALPAALATILTTGSHLYLQASVVGPLAVAPLFFASRLLGLMVHSNRHRLRDILAPVAKEASAAPALAATARESAPRADALQQAARQSAERHAPARQVASPKAPSRSAPGPRAPSRQAPPRPTAAATAHPTNNGEPARPTLRTTSATPPKVAAVRRPAPAPVGPLPTTVTHPVSAGRAPAPREAKPAAVAKRPSVAARPAGAPAPACEPHLIGTLGGKHKATPAAPAAAPAAAAAPCSSATEPAPAARTKVAISDHPPPDFTQMPGFNVVTGAARVLAGAASRMGSRRRS